MQQPLISLYALINPLNDHVFYVGASFDPYHRLQSHVALRNKEKSFKAAQIREIMAQNKKARVFTLEKCAISEVNFWEEFYIDLFRSWGFKINQLRKSSYKQANETRFFKKEFSKNKALTYIPDDLPKKIYEILGDYNEYEMHLFVEAAVREKIENIESKQLKSKKGA